ncbi:DUF1206 domain-containing protein [Gracilimonas mengyeensis]|uniref:DUF1206 domain-containing protein n=1 Tax=Gracilimonas mengyeensis TaxID=1302730 RepID=A0A521F4Y7_9BACT|nr:DUF1206 domain-containing protein [Gracilimonas mengyeensis]SMO91228.1 protein of unknown function [Gracilimonas mengyeensis]
MKTLVAFIARTGYITKGIVYFFVGLFAVQAAIGVSAAASGTKQTIQEFIYRPFGDIILYVCMAGLFAHAVWRILQAIKDPEERGSGAGVMFFRLIDFLTGCLYISLSYACWQILQGLQTQSSDKNTEVWVGKILVLPFGKWLVLFCALVIVVAGLYQFYSAAIASFDYSFEDTKMSEKEKKMLRTLGQIGISAWGVVYCMVGFLFYQAAMQFDADEAGGLSDALNALQEQPFGVWILGATAGGLLIYGIYLLILSYYHKIYGR